MSKKKTTTSVDRRDFFRKVGFGVGAAALGATATRTQAAAPGEASAKRAGYRETEHVKKYYDLARF
ncbi:MAG: formate dehydrogenase [Kiloniellaceae bacterium]